VGDAVVTISLDSWPEGLVAPTTHKISVIRPKAREAAQPVSSRFMRTLIHPERKAYVSHVRFSSDGARLFTAGSPSGIVQFWDVATGKEITRINTGTGRRGFELPDDWSVVYVPQENRTMTRIKNGDEQDVRSDYDGLILAFDLVKGEPRPPLKPPSGSGVLNAFVSPDGRKLVAVEQPSGLRTEQKKSRTVLWDIRTATAKPLGDGYAQSAAFSPDSRRLALCQNDVREPMAGVLKLLDAAGTELAELTTVKGDVVSWPKFSPDGTRLVVQQSKNRINQPAVLHVFDVQTRKELAAFKSDGNIAFEDYGFATDGERIAATHCDKGHVRIWDVTTGKTVLDKSVSGDVRFRHPAFSPDGRRLAVLGQPKWDEAEFGPEPDPRNLPQPRVYLFDLTNAAAEPEIIICPHGWLGGLAFSPDGKTLAVGGAGATHLFDVARRGD
jgi:WD40 repeat protein